VIVPRSKYAYGNKMGGTVKDGGVRMITDTAEKDHQMTKKEFVK